MRTPSTVARNWANGWLGGLRDLSYEGTKIIKEVKP